MWLLDAALALCLPRPRRVAASGVGDVTATRPQKGMWEVGVRPLMPVAVQRQGKKEEAGKEGKEGNTGGEEGRRT